MIEIVRMKEGREIQAFPVLTGKILVGRRAPDSVPDIEIEDPRVSRKHLNIIKEENRLFAENVSRNEVLVNSKPVLDRRELHDGDTLQVCSAEFVIRIQKSAPIKVRWIVLLCLVSLVLLAGFFILRQIPHARAPHRTNPAAPKTVLHHAGPAIDESQVKASRDYTALLFQNRDNQTKNRYLACIEMKNLLNTPLSDSMKSSYRKKIAMLEGEIDSIYKLFKTGADIAFRQGNKELCTLYLKKILELVPEVRDQRHLWAQESFKRIRKLQ
jgi:pSer/pThr/pTyr-binding forkhead associated (FHA) protein